MEIWKKNTNGLELVSESNSTLVLSPRQKLTRKNVFSKEVIQH